ncbi:dynein axonemal assembly factor 11 isoform X2 [Neocloeon triangulifer]|uniref:dynein axonemal assembly factor 11 isoform X2 n=1 Tax=Neocloeon triangulifer TaxID=2078957 RepID=UPI00286ECA1F|nr:dynein axonemal assembly factor 11 isoform X2 [Neocloeon triangulifer]
MSKLTEPMIIARAKSSDLNTIKKLNCWGNELTDVSLVQRMPNVEVLALSVNNISSLADFRCCSKLRELYMRKNSISELNEVCYLQDCANLQNLTLTENPCTNFEGYRLAVIRALPRLQKLDDVEVTDEERRNALRQGVDLVHPEDEDCQYQVPSYPSQEHNGYSNGIKYESDEPTWEESIEEAPAEPNGRQSSPEMSPDQTPPEMESPEPPRQYHDEYADRRNANYNNSEHSGYSQRRDSTQSYHSTGQSYQQQQSYQPLTPNSPDPLLTPQRRQKEASPEVAPPFLPPSPSSPPNLPQNTPISSTCSPSEHCPRFRSDSEPRVCPEQLALYPCNHQDEDYYYRSQQQPRQRFHHPSSMQQHPPSVPITGNGRPKSRLQVAHVEISLQTSNILSAVLCLLKELDYQSLEVVDNTVNARMNELMHEHNA